LTDVSEELTASIIRAIRLWGKYFIKSTRYRWFSQFKDGQNSVEEKER
jgi:hypothetical protein